MINNVGNQGSKTLKAWDPRYIVSKKERECLGCAGGARVDRQRAREGLAGGRSLSASLESVGVKEGCLSPSVFVVCVEYYYCLRFRCE